MENNKKIRKFWYLIAFTVIFLLAIVLIKPFDIIYFYQKIAGKIKSSYIVGNVNVVFKNMETEKFNLLRYRETTNGHTFDQLSWFSKDLDEHSFPFLEVFVNSMDKQNGIRILNRPAALSLFAKNKDKFVEEKRIVNINCFDDASNTFSNKFDMIRDVVSSHNDKPLFCIAKYGENEVSFVRIKDFYEITFIKDNLTVITENPFLIKHFDFMHI